MAATNTKNPRRLEVSDLVLEFQGALIELELGKRADTRDYAEMLTAAATRLEAGIQEFVERHSWPWAGLR